MDSFSVCESCHRHVKATETSCPFCRSARSRVGVTAALVVGDAYVGRLEEARISSTVRYPGNTYTVPGAAFAPDASTRALWHFDAAVGATVFSDASGNGNTLTGANGAHIE